MNKDKIVTVNRKSQHFCILALDQIEISVNKIDIEGVMGKYVKHENVLHWITEYRLMCKLNGAIVNNLFAIKAVLQNWRFKSNEIDKPKFEVQHNWYRKVDKIIELLVWLAPPFRLK